MPSATYIRKRKEAARDRSMKGVAARERIRKERAVSAKVVGTMRTDGVFGDHEIQLVSYGDEDLLWPRVDGVIRQPRTLGGIKRIVSEWIWNKATVTKESDEV